MKRLLSAIAIAFWLTTPLYADGIINPGASGGGGSGVASVGNYPGDNTLTITGTGSGPWTGTVTIECTIATPSQIGCVQPDGTIITDTAGAITVAKGSASAFGVIETSTGLSATGGVVSCVSASGTTVGCIEPATPPALGGTTPAAGAFTTLSASSTVSGTGFSTYLASPPAIGGTAAAAATFTALSGTTSLKVAGATLPSSTIAALLGETYTYTTGNIGTYFTGAALNVGGGAFFSTDNNNQNIGLVISGPANSTMAIAANAWPSGGNWTYINNSQGAMTLNFNVSTQQLQLQATSTTGSVGGTITFSTTDQFGPGGWSTSSYSAEGMDTMDAGKYYAGGIAGLASKTCTINTANVTTGITITITGGIVTGTTTC